MKHSKSLLVRGGYAGSCLWIDLTTEKVRKEPLDAEMVQSFIGMRGFTSKLLWDRVRGVDAYDPKNLVMFAVGPLAGITPTGGRALVAAKSPLTGLIGYANFGGHWGPALKYAGYDLVVVEGKAETPVYLWIEDDRVEIRDASALWGKDTRQTVKGIEKELGPAEIEVLAIGPAGEKLVRFACAMTYDGHSAGRTGMGAVMGSKNLKAVAVRGTGKLGVANEPEYRKIMADLLQHLKRDEISGVIAPSLGTTVLLNIVNETGALGTRNFQSGYFDKAYEISGETMKERFTPPGRGRACFMCPIGCDRYTSIKEGEFAGTWSAGGPEYATLTNQGARVGNSNLAAIIKANELCNRLGLDTYSTGGVLGFVFELYQRGILTGKETDGLELNWGDYKVQLELIRKMAYREGFGDLLAEGVKRIADRVGEGAEKYAVQVKGMEYPSKDARGDKMYGLCCATAGRGADHLYSLSEFPVTVELDKIREMFGTDKAVDPHLPDGKGKVVAFFEEGCTFTDLLGICKLVYVTYVASMGELLFRREVLPGFYEAVTGLSLSYEGLIEAAHRVTALERAFNIREAGIGRKEDYLPSRFLNEPMPDGPAKGRVFEADRMLDEYYDAKEFERKTGWPYLETMEKLGLKKVAEELRKAGYELPRKKRG
jgi:aldehyde:ferredoxin oxidoreductase